MRIYLDNAATTPMLPEVIEEMTKVMREDFGNPSSIHSYGRKARSIVENARKIVAKCINASIGEVFFTSSATEANNMILTKAVDDLNVKRIITSPIEHHCVLHTLLHLQKTKSIQLCILDVDNLGNIDLNQLKTLLSQPKQGTTLVSLMHGNNEIGTINDIKSIGLLCSEFGALFHSDTVQTIGRYPINVQTDRLHFITGSAHKFHGPKGIGFVYICNDNMISPMIHGGAQERNMRAGTENVAGIAGLAIALENSTSKMEVSRTYILNLKLHFRNLLVTALKDIQFNGSLDSDALAHVLSVSFPPGFKADMLMMNLDIAGISASSGSACSAGIEEDSHVLSAIGHPKERKTIRFSFSIFNTIQEIETTVNHLKTLTAVNA
jgi:cysteine desulfurase